MPMFKVVVQKNVPGKSSPKERDLERARRVVIVEASTHSAAMGFVRLTPAARGADYVDVVSVELAGRYVVLAP